MRTADHRDRTVPISKPGRRTTERDVPLYGHPFDRSNPAQSNPAVDGGIYTGTLIQMERVGRGRHGDSAAITATGRQKWPRL